MKIKKALPVLACLPLLLAAAWPVAVADGRGPAHGVGAFSGQRVRRGSGLNSNRKTKVGAKKKMNSNSAAKSNRVPAGVWGGDHIRMVVREDGAAVVYDCARGTVDAPLVLDDGGRFSVAGAHVREHPGPIRLDIPRVSRPARYTGAVEGETMTLTVTLTDESEEVGTFKLTRGGGGRIVKCR